MQRRVDLDLAYVQHKSLALDLLILARTLKAVRQETGVY
jgi:lipopolysaccharide/colanic/teichoic acid biosynthesis glycosyltransferase